MKFVMLFCLLNLIVPQIVYPAIRIHQIGLLQNGNVTVVPFIERASPAPWVPRDPKGRRLVIAIPKLPNVTVSPPIDSTSPAPLESQDPNDTQMTAS